MAGENSLIVIDRGSEKECRIPLQGSNVEGISDNYIPLEEQIRQNKRPDPMTWIQSQIADGADPRSILQQLLPNLTLPDHTNDLSLWKLIFEIVSEPSPRERLPHVSTINHVQQLLKDSKRILVLTGAGVSVSCGIPDFRSRDGIYARLSKDYPDLPDPQAMFDIHYFRSNPWPFFKFAKEIYPGQFTPSLCHRFIAHLDKSGRLLRNYSQNIDTLEQVAGIKNTVQCHGSFTTASCMSCKYQVSAEIIKADIFEQKIPICKQCVADTEGKKNILKPDIVFFGESLPESFHKQIEADKDKADLLIVIGSSLKVRPVSLLPSLVKPNVPQILINREPLHHMQFDVELYGNCDDVICELCNQLGDDWTDIIGSFVPKPMDQKAIQRMINEANGVYQSEEEIEDELSSEKLNDEEKAEAKMKNDENDTSTKNYLGDASVINKCSDCVNNDKDINSQVEERIENLQNPLKRNCSCSEENISKKHRKENTESMEQEEMFYLPIPPGRRYLFYGAEIDLRPDDESDDEESSDDASIEYANELKEETQNNRTEEFNNIDTLNNSTVNELIT